MNAFTKTFFTILLSLLPLQPFVSAHAIPQVGALTSRDSPTGRCGAQGNGAKCDSYGAVNACCSVNGWCGDSTDHCGTGCQEGFGKCGVVSTAPTQPGTGGRPHIGNVAYGVEIASCSVPGTFAITYDDGPFTYTTDLLNILANAGAKATFFITGNNLGKGAIDEPGSQWAPVIRRMIAEGHQIASHTWDHMDLGRASQSDVQYQMTRLETALKTLIGKYPTYMRPPYISTSPSMLQTMNSLGYHTIIWDLNTDDYSNQNAVAIQKSKDLIVEHLDADRQHWNSIAHDIHFQTVYNLTQFQIDKARERGFRLVTIGECLGDPEGNWYRT